MCTTCGCSDGALPRLTDPATGEILTLDTAAPPGARATPPDGASDPAAAVAGAHGTTVPLEQAVLAENDRLAERNRAWLAARGILALNLVSSPGAGKTTLLERTLRNRTDPPSIGVIEGDQETQFDVERIRATGCRAVQINTGTGCHLDADMIAGALDRLAPPPGSLVMIENVGNLVCPALFDLGEAAKVAILSVTEGTDKPLKYPHLFRSARLMILNKIDLLPHVDFDVTACIAFARRVNPDIEVIPLSATRGEGLDDWYAWLNRQRDDIAGGHRPDRGEPSVARPLRPRAG
ncbi:hydrogenase nickel incorporation protein HypB [Halomonas beimenensis]|uniref:Hydrogenase maturation factor HypB n=1 Tax=Halomonas beimenensis TaxID=475662 RepID=A0A291P5W7_9GAMM|nr:hydrogenase nickel incorporation protein HypB [Halomonas beimenensis]ATJ82261.1 [NiFe] hydrogenase nickel incorporation-associated protein HypB [Halomonas beimenensis]